MQLFKVTLKGMTGGISSETAYGVSYVVAEDPTKAYAKLKAFLDEKDLGFDSDRILDRIELIADEKQYGSCGHMLFL